MGNLVLTRETISMALDLATVVINQLAEKGMVHKESLMVFICDHHYFDACQGYDFGTYGQREFANQKVRPWALVRNSAYLALKERQNVYRSGVKLKVYALYDRDFLVSVASNEPKHHELLAQVIAGCMRGSGVPDKHHRFYPVALVALQN